MKSKGSRRRKRVKRSRKRSTRRARKSRRMRMNQTPPRRPYPSSPPPLRRKPSEKRMVRKKKTKGIPIQRPKPFIRLCPPYDDFNPLSVAKRAGKDLEHGRVLISKQRKAIEEENTADAIKATEDLTKWGLAKPIEGLQLQLLQQLKQAPQDKEKLEELVRNISAAYLEKVYVPVSRAIGTTN